jgi:hypothetical protein
MAGVFAVGFVTQGLFHLPDAGHAWGVNVVDARSDALAVIGRLQVGGRFLRRHRLASAAVGVG